MSTAAEALAGRVRETGLLPGGAPVVVLLSGGRDSVCLLDLAVLLAGPGAVTALHVNYGLRAESAADEALCEELCRRLEVPLDGRGRGGAGAAPATSRPGRATCATAPARGWRRRAARGSPPATPSTDQVETILYRLAASPGRRALLGHAGAARAARAAAAGRRRRPRGDGRVVRGARPGVGRGREQRRGRVRPHPGPHRASSPRCARCTRPPRRTCCAPPSCCATRRRSSTRSSTRCSPGGDADRARAPRGAAAGARAPRRPPARRGGRRRPVRAGRGPRCRTSSRSSGPAAARATLDVGDGARAVVEDGVLRFERTPPRAAGPGAVAPAEGRANNLPRAMTEAPPIGEILVQPDQLKERVRALGRQISDDYAGRDLLLVGVLKGAVFFLADLMRSIDGTCEVDFMAVASYGSATDSSGVVRILKDLDTPIEGRDVLIVEDIVDSGPHAPVPAAQPRRPRARLARGLRAADQARAPQGRPADPLRRLRDPEPLRDRLRPRPRRALPQPAVRRGARASPAGDA